MNRENNKKNITFFERHTFINYYYSLSLLKTTVGTIFFFLSEPKYRALVYHALALTDPPPFVAKQRPPAAAAASQRPRPVRDFQVEQEDGGRLRVFPERRSHRPAAPRKHFTFSNRETS